jgi:hypothetical protein
VIHSLNAGHSANIAILGPATLLSLWAMAVDGTRGDPHLTGDQVADAVLPVCPFHLIARLSWDSALFQTRQSRFPVNAHQLAIYFLDATSLGSFSNSLSAKSIVSVSIQSTPTIDRGRGQASSLCGAHGEFIVRVSKVTISIIFKSVVKNFTLDIFPEFPVNGLVVIDTHRHLPPLRKLFFVRRDEGSAKQKGKGEDKKLHLSRVFGV